MRHEGCYSIDTKVIDSRWKNGRIWRRRECLKCHRRFNTYETTQEEFNAVDNEKKRVNELEQPVWAVITFDRVMANGVTYAEAVEVMNAADPKDSGVVIVTAEVADRAEATRSTKEQPTRC
jgi:hypothetical protein